MTPENIKELRAKRGLTQSALAKQVGVGLRALQRWEDGSRSPSRQSVILLEQVASRGTGATKT
jgi:DNA-binding transcriptional regulator YiaG